MSVLILKIKIVYGNNNFINFNLCIIFLNALKKIV